MDLRETIEEKQEESPRDRRSPDGSRRHKGDPERVKEIALGAVAAASGAPVQILAQTPEAMLKAAKRMITIGAVLIAGFVAFSIAHLLVAEVGALNANIIGPIILLMSLVGIILFFAGIANRQTGRVLLQHPRSTNHP
jgi:hypothetical protein